jgi:hypothetical protein
MRDYDNDILTPVESMVEIREERVYDERPSLPPLGELNLKEYKPKKQEILREYEIRIKFLSVGCVVNVGCKEIPFRSVKEAMDNINKYVENPYEEGKKWHSIFDGEE